MCVPMHECIAHVSVCIHMYAHVCLSERICMCTCECLHVCGYERGAAHRCEEIGSLPQEPRLPPLPAPTPCPGRGPSSIKRARSPECPCCSIPHLPTLPPRPVPEGGGQKHQVLKGLLPPNHPGAGTGVEEGGWALGGCSPLPRGAGVQGCVVLPTEPLLDTGSLRGS